MTHFLFFLTFFLGKICFFRNHQLMRRSSPLLRYRPYRVPQTIVLALHQFRLLEGHSCSSGPAPLLKGVSLQEIRLLGCDFHGRALPTVDRHLFNSYRETKGEAKPCWLQHAQGRQREGGKGQEPMTDIANNGGGQQQQDHGVGELSDYFQHFVCLCSPRMSDQAQSMYA